MRAEPFKFIILFGPNIAAALILAARFASARSPISRAALAAVFSVCQMIFITCALGCAGMISYRNLATVQCATLAAIIIFSAAVQKKRLAADTNGSAPLAGGVLELAIIAATLILGGYVFLWASVTPPPCSDSFLYHLTLPVKWIQNGHIFPARTDPFGLAFHPSNPETALLWIMISFMDDSFVNLISCVFWFMSGATIFAIARRLGAERIPSLLSCLVWLILPLPFSMAPSAEIDHFSTFFFLAAILFMLHFEESESVADLAAGGLSLGVYLGSKLIALPFSAPAILLFAWLAMRQKQQALKLAVFSISALAPAAAWYILNWRLTGNPIFPIGFSLFGHSLAAGPVTRDHVVGAQALLAENASFADTLVELTGIYMGMILAGALAAAAMRLSLAKKLCRAFAISIPAIHFGMFVYFGCMGQDYASRYLLPAAALACAAWAVSAPDNKLLKAFYFVVSFICAADAVGARPFTLMLLRQTTAAVGGSSPMPDLIPISRSIAIAASVCLAAIFACVVLKRPARSRAALLSALLAAIFFIALYPGFSKYYSRTKYFWYRPSAPGLAETWLTLNNIYPKPLNIGVAGTNLYHGFNGSGFKNRVFNLNYGQRALPFQKPLLEELSENNISVFAYSLPIVARKRDNLEGHRPDPIFEIIRANPASFAPLAQNGNVRVYQVIPPGGNAPKLYYKNPDKN